jgi:hypothetical protein
MDNETMELDLLKQMEVAKDLAQALGYLHTQVSVEKKTSQVSVEKKRHR